MYMLLNNNAFIEATLQLSKSDVLESNWTKGVVYSFESHNFDQLPYYQSQIFEPSIIFEVSRFTNNSKQEINNLEYELSGNIKILKWLIDNIKYVTPVQKLNLSYSLSSIARYELANKALKSINPSQLLNHEKIFYYFQKFILSNRTDPNKKCEEEFTNIKELLENNNYSLKTQLFLSSQAIVWYLKTNFISENLYQWYVNLGSKAADSLKESTVSGDIHALSTFYRAYAMIPAETGDSLETRKEMEKCLYFANKLEPKSDFQKVVRLDVFKTYYESTIKEHMYLTKDLAKAEEAGLKLISLDPNWSISYQELGDVYMQMGAFEKALNEYRKAKKLILPRYGISLFKEASCLEKMGEYEEAIDVYKELLKFDPYNITSGINGLKIAKKLNSSVDYFEDTINKWKENDLVPEQMKEVLV
ncbi:tetratricopeptide repeat protein [Bacillus sp. SM2101]|uniref:tetratricopeptide repeat protein n=1 Tax=Bacillus sp. SM2101 TaxID=2805366 RepID=UPI002032B053|nr:tetratricopeptide repeat protein [Bacillus sp. SM2101]